jgi:PPM family protein phosphatase
VDLLTIGAFARSARLTPKALRLYDQLGLLTPAAVDPESGYRLYDPGQLDKARLIARLRGIGMPLAEIREVCGLEPAAAAEAVDAYRKRLTADAADRARQATLLVDDLSRRDTAMPWSLSERHQASARQPDKDASFAIRYAARSDTGAVRDTNEDAAYASGRLFAVADGMRGPGGAAASTTAIDVLKPLELLDAPAADLLTMMAAALAEAHEGIRGGASGEEEPVTTLTAMLRSGTQLALVHVGDTRAYLLRDGELRQLTQDHTYVQSLVDTGRLEPAAVASHPQRALLVRALGAGGTAVEVDLALRTAAPGDRYLLCSDGLSAIVERVALRTELAAAADPEDAVRRLVDLAHAQGAPDNIACVVAEVVRAPGSGRRHR